MLLVDDREALLSEHHAVWQARPVDLTLGAATPWAQVPDRIGQSMKRSLALAAEEMEACVLA
jgi:hypothetical protein